MINLRHLLHFLDKSVSGFCVKSIFIGALLVAVDLSLAFSINVLFYTLGLAYRVPNIFGYSFDNIDKTLVFAVFLGLGTMRGILTWIQLYTEGAALVEFEAINRERLTAWAFANRKVSAAEISNLFSSCTPASGLCVSRFVGSLARAVISILLLLSLFYLSVPVTCTILVIFAIVILPVRVLLKKINTISSVMHKYLDYAVIRLLTGIKNKLLLHIYDTYNRESQATIYNIQVYKKHYKFFYFLSGLKTIVPPTFGVWMICVISYVALHTSTLHGGAFISYFYLFLRYSQALGELANLWSEVTLNKLRFWELYHWWIENYVHKNKLQIINATKPVNTFSLNQEIFGWEARSLSFAYANSNTKVLSNLNFTVQPGEMLVITGKSGVGKSTLLSLMLGLEKPMQGQLSVIAKNHMEAVENVRSAIIPSIGYVGSESFIVSGTVYENLCYGAKGAFSDDELKQVLKMAGCDFIFDLPGGLQHEITEHGEGLSAGQKQRLSLARALLRQPKVLVLDEATANLDKNTESQLIETFRNLKRRMTIVAVTHRDALITISDQVLAL
ncbi:MAG: hypothetical protein Tsb005_05170 [Gammaproteobacteria bacterium]